MGDYLTLLGAEQVQAAGARIAAAAETMSRAAGTMDEATARQRAHLDGWLSALEVALADHRNAFEALLARDREARRLGGGGP